MAWILLHCPVSGWADDGIQCVGFVSSDVAYLGSLRKSRRKRGELAWTRDCINCCTRISQVGSCSSANGCSGERFRESVRRNKCFWLMILGIMAISSICSCESRILLQYLCIRNSATQYTVKLLVTTAGKRMHMICGRRCPEIRRRSLWFLCRILYILLIWINVKDQKLQYSLSMLCTVRAWWHNLSQDPWENIWRRTHVAAAQKVNDNTLTTSHTCWRTRVEEISFVTHSGTM